LGPVEQSGGLRKAPCLVNEQEGAEQVDIEVAAGMTHYVIKIIYKMIDYYKFVSAQFKVMLFHGQEKKKALGS
jgi:hypothetical protein